MSKEVSAQEVKALRERTGAGIMACKNALVECAGNMEAAIELLRKQGEEIATKRQGRKTANGIVYSYVHAGDQIGVLVEVNCESDFVARNEDFRQFGKDVAMQIAAMRPLWLSREEVPEEAIAKEREILTEQALGEGKPEHIVEKMVEGRLKKFYEQYCLLEQPFIRDDSQTIQDLLTDLIARTGENCIVSRFCRYQVGEE
ncbi:MAG: translation elongation factor Ts [candidate division WS1 bacterium]|nr:translation elongation factor Ts [candidate division WS1 bacterium]